MTVRGALRTAVALVAGCALYAGCGDDESPGGATTPAASRNGLIVFSAEKQGAPTQLVTIRPDGTDAIQITQLPEGEAVHPDWSPDGSQIVYNGQSAAGAGIIVIGADGSGPRNLAPKGERNQPSFSPDGAQIVFERDVGPGDNGIYVMRRDGTGAKRLTRNPFPQPDGCGCDTDPNFSPDGTTITFVRIQKADELGALFAMDADGTNVRRLTPYTDDVATKHSWSPDGSRIALTINANPAPGESANIVTIRPDGTDRRPVTRFTDGRRAYVGSYSPDGKRLAIRLEDGAKLSVATIASGGGAIERLTTSTTTKPRFIDWGAAR